MAYTTLLSACVIVIGMAAERSLGPHWPKRWLWLAALLGALGVTVLAFTVPRPQSSTEATTTTLAPASVATAATGDKSWLPILDRGATIAWAIATAVLLLAMSVCAVRLRDARRRAGRIRVGDADVLLTDNLGPAVAGLARPVVLVPRWVLTLDEPRQRLLIAHENEHARAGDVRLLWFASLAVAFTPWNPAVWWLARRLRLAVEMDCDLRVLARSPSTRDYAELLLVAAHRRAPATLVSVPHFGGATSDLSKRIDAMTLPRKRPTTAQRLLWITLASGALAVACESPRPEPVAPIDLKGSEAQATRYTEIPVAASRREYQDLVKSIDSLRLVAARLHAIIDKGRARIGTGESKVGDAAAGPALPMKTMYGDNSELRLQPAGLDPATQIVIVDGDGKEALVSGGRPGPKDDVRMSGQFVLDEVRPEHLKQVEIAKAARCEWGGRVIEPCGIIRMQLKPGVKLSEFVKPPR